MPDKSLPIEEILTLLSEGPGRLADLTVELSPAELRAAPDAGEWSSVEVLAHLRSCADVWGGCIARILDEDHPTYWINQTDYPQLEFRPSLQAFTTQRADLMVLLKSLPPESWARSATVTGAGKPLERSVHSYAQWMATHERPHIKQIKRIAETMRGRR